MKAYLTTPSVVRPMGVSRLAAIMLSVLLSSTFVSSTSVAASASFVMGNSATSCTVGKHPFGIAFDSTNGYIYVANVLSDTVSVIQAPCKVIATISLGTPVNNAFNDAYLAFDPVNDLIYVSDTAESSVVVINGTTTYATITDSFGSFHNATGIAADPVSGKVFVVDYGSQISVIDGTTVVNLISIDGATGGGTITYGAGNMYVSGPFSVVNANEIFVIGTSCLCVQGHLKVKGTATYGMAYDPSNGYLYASDFKKGLVQVFDASTDKLFASIPVRANGPLGIAFNPSNNEIYVAEFCHACLQHSNVTVINGLSVVRTIPLRSGPFFLAYSSVNQMMYVTLSGKTVQLVS